MKKLLFCVLILFSTALFSQVVPKTVKYKGEELYIYPSRSETGSEVPPTPVNLPDGKYALLHTFIFKRNILKKKMVLVDTLRVRGVFTLKNNLPEGKAEFFTYTTKRNWSSKKIPFKSVSGSFEKGEKSGEWVEENSRIHEKIIYHYKNGSKHGKYEWYRNGKILLKKSFEEGYETDTVFHYDNKGAISTVYDLVPKGFQKKTDDWNCYDFIYSNHTLVAPSPVRPLKSFYKSYDKKEKLTANIKAQNGTVVYFDTVYYSDEKIFINKTNTSHKDSADQFVLHRVSPIYYGYRPGNKKGYKDEMSWYIGKRKYKVEYFKKYNNPKIRNEWMVSTYNDPDSIKANSTHDFICGQYIEDNKRETFHLVPALGYSWMETVTWDEKGSRRHFSHYPEKMDTALHIVYTTDTFELNRFYFVAGPLKLFSKPKEKERTEEKNDYTKYNFLYDDKIPRIKTYERIRNHSNGRYIPGFTEEYSGIMQSTTTFDSLGPINGEYVYGYWPKKLLAVIKNKKRIPASSPLMDYGKGNYSAGKKTGTWEFLEYLPVKEYSENWRKNFDSRKGKSAGYIAASFSNDQLNGKFEKYITELEHDFENPGPFNKKNPYRKYFTYKSSSFNFVNDTLHGVQTKFFHNGKPQFTVEYKMGLLNGLLACFDNSGKPEISVSFKDNLLHGPYKLYADGKLHTEAVFEENNLNGSYISYNVKTAKKFLEIVAQQNILRSKKTWFSNGQLQEEIIFDQGSGFEFTQKFSGTTCFLEATEGSSKMPLQQKLYGSARSFYDNGQVLSEGKMAEGKPKGKWNFYNINGALINEVNFYDSLCVLPGDTEKTKLLGSITGYFNNGKVRCRGFVLKHTTAYDCGTRQQKTDFKLFYTDAFDFDGNTVIKNGNGKGFISNEDGLKISFGEYKNYRREGKWMYYDPNQKLCEVGYYQNNLKEGIWYRGDLEGLNFEDGACFNPDDKRAMAAFEYRKKTLTFETVHYLNNRLQSYTNFTSNQNTNIVYKDYPYKKYKRKRHRKRRGRGYFSGTPSF